jgi:6-phosphofructokinase 1
MRHHAETLGSPRFDTPLEPGTTAFVGEGATSDGYERAGARARLFFEPGDARAGIVTCGGLCPGTNNVVRTLFLTLLHRYRVYSVTGFRFGLAGMVAGGPEPMRLTPEAVRHAHRSGGTLLGTSRGRQDTGAIVDTLVLRSIDMLFLIGGNGTIRAARDIHAEIARRGLPIAVVVVPKTIDDDVPLVDKTFGFDTAVGHAAAAIDAAHAEAVSAENGIGLVKLMGRDAGLVTVYAAIASGEANFCLVPEVPFALEGDGGLFAALRARLARRGHAVIVVAEGCGASLAWPGAERDASGNLRYASAGLDIGPRLRDALARYFAEAHVPVTIKYIDPSYTIRAAVAGSTDAIYCAELARHAAHAAMAGRTDVLVGRIHGTFVHVPLALAAAGERRLDRAAWEAVCEITGQPESLRSARAPTTT